MFPIISTLRRCASTFIYVQPEMLQKIDGRYWVKLSSPSMSLNFTQGIWNPSTDLVPLYICFVRSKTEQSAAISLAKKETALFDSLKLKDTMYTLVFGPEEQRREEDLYVRDTKIALIRGVYRASSPVQLDPVPSRQVVRAFGSERKRALQSKP